MERIGREVERTLSRTGDGRALELSRIADAWPKAVGDAIARQAWPLRLGRDRTLHVATSSATWAFELDRLAPELACRLGEVLGPSSPTRFRFRIGPVPEPGSVSPEPPATARETPPEAAALAELAAAEIEDPELRELVARAARASLASGRSGRTF